MHKDTFLYCLRFLSVKTGQKEYVSSDLQANKMGMINNYRVFIKEMHLQTTPGNCIVSLLT